MSYIWHAKIPQPDKELETETTGGHISYKKQSTNSITAHKTLMTMLW